jgi:HSP20 family protein
MAYRMTVAAPIFGLRRDIDRLFVDTFGANDHGRWGLWAPATEIREDDKEITMTVELPGVSASDVEVTAENGVLAIKGEKKEQRKEGDESSRYHVLERTYGSFTRSFQLPKGLDESKIDARFEHGVLTVRVPKAAIPQPKKIEIKA